MDKDEYFKVLDELCSFNFNEFLTNHHFINETTLSSLNKKDEIPISFENNKQIYQNNSHISSSSSENKEKDKKKYKIKNSELISLYRNFPFLINEQIYSQKVFKETEKMKLQLLSHYSHSVHKNRDKYFEKKLKFYEKLLSNYSKLKYKYNKLIFFRQPLLEKYSLTPKLIMESFPGLKPNSNWPFSLDDLLLKMKDIEFEELFHQPVDEKIKNEFINEALEQIKKFDKENDIINFNKGIIILFSFLIFFGDFIQMLKSLIDIKSNVTNKKILNEIFLNNNEYSEILKKAIQNLFKLASSNDYKPYPIMRNYSIIDTFNISKNILYSPYSQSKSSFTNSSTACTDGTYIYVNINGIDGCKAKIGSGLNGTEKGKIYYYLSNKNLNSINNIYNNSYQWVYCNGKIYQKTISSNLLNTSYFGSNYNDSKDIGYINVISTEDFSVESTLKLILPQNALHQSVLKRNENFILLSDGVKLSIIILEPITNDKEENDLLNNEFLPNPNVNQSHFNYLNLECITYNPNPFKYNENDENLNEEKRKLIDEIYEGFSQIFTKEECFKALLRNDFDIMKTALYLVDNPPEIKQSLLIGEKPIILFQGKINLINMKSVGKPEIVLTKNPYFDILQFDLLKWSIDENYIIAHKYKEGAAVLFGRNEEKYLKEFNYSIKKPISNETNEARIRNLLNNNFIDYISKPGSNFKDVKIKFASTSTNVKDNKNDVKHSKTTLNDKDKKGKDDIKENPKFQIIEDKLKGTLIKILPSIQLLLKLPSNQLNESDYVTTYDLIHNIYYLMVPGSLNSINFLVSDTFISFNEEYFKLFNINTNHLNDYFIDNNFLNNFSFDDLSKNLLSLMIILSTNKKPDSYLRFKNWNFYYNYFLEFMNIKSIKYNSNYDNEYIFNLFPLMETLPLSNKTIINRVEKFASENKEQIFSQLPKELIENYKVIEIVSSQQDIFKQTLYSKYKPIPNLNNSGNWISESRLMFKISEKKKKKKDNEKNEEIVYNTFFESLKNKMVFIDNKLYSFFGMKGEFYEIEYLIDLFEKNENNDNFEINQELILKLIYIWICNCNDFLFIQNKEKFEEIFSKLKNNFYKILKDEKIGEKIKNLILLIIIEGWEEFNQDLESQKKWFIEIFNYQKNGIVKEIKSHNIEKNILSNYFNNLPFNSLLEKNDYTRCSLNLNNNFNKINIIKAFTLYPVIYKGRERLVLKPSNYSISPKNIQIPFYYNLYGFNLNEIKLPINKEKNTPIIIEIGKIEKKITTYKKITVNQKHSKINQFLENIPIKSHLDIYNSIKSNSTDIFEFFKENIQKEPTLLSLLTKFYFLSIADLNNNFIENIINMKNICINENKLNKNSNCYSNNNFDYYLKFVEYLTKSYDKINEICQKNENIESIFLFENMLYSIFSKIKICSLDNIPEFNNIFVNSTKLLLEKINNKKISLINEQGINYEREKELEYVLTNIEMVNIYNKFSMDSKSNNNIFCVKVFYKQLTQGSTKNLNSDLLIISEDHTYQNLKYNNNNNINNFGTCFKIELNNSFKKTLTFFVKGSEIKIVSPSSIELEKIKKIISSKTVSTNAYYGNYNSNINFYNNSAYNNKNKNQSTVNSKSILKIRVFPYNNHLALIPLNLENKLYYNEILYCIQDAEFYSSLIFKLLMKSFVVNNDDNIDVIRKFSITRLGLKENNYKLILDKFEKYKSNIFFNNSNYESCGLFNLNNEEINSIFNDEIESFIPILLNKIRETVKEPISYINIKKIPSFNNEIKIIWNKIELLFLYTLLYHLNLLKDFKHAFEKDNLNTIEPYFETLGKKINIIIGKMSNNAKIMKDTFDSIKNNIYDFIEAFNLKYKEIKDKILNEIYDIDLNKKEKEDEKVIKKDNKKIVGEENSNKKFKDLDEKFGKKGTNYKKKNVSRTVYKEEKKKKKKKKKNKDENNQEDKKEEENPILKKNISELIEKPPKEISKEIQTEIKNLKNLQSTYKTKINNEINSFLYGDKDKIKNLCDLYHIEFNDSNPNESITKYSEYIYKEFNLILSNTSKELNEINIKEKEKEIQSKSPFITLANTMIQNLSFLLSLNNFDENENNDFNIMLLERIQSFNRTTSSYSLSHRSSSMKKQSSNTNMQNEDNYLFNKNQQIILKSVMYFILKSQNNIQNIIQILNKQYIRALVRNIGIKEFFEYVKIFKDNQNLTNYFYGIISFAVGKDIHNGIETVNLSNFFLNKEEKKYIIAILNNELIEFNKNCEFFEKYEKNKKDCEYLLIMENQISKSLNIKVEEYFMKLKNILLILSDLNIIIKFVGKHKSLYENEIDLKLFENTIRIIFDFIFNLQNYSNLISRNYIHLLKMKAFSNESMKLIINEIISLSNSSLNEYILNELYNQLIKINISSSNLHNVLELIRNIVISIKPQKQKQKGSSKNLKSLNPQNSQSSLSKISSKLIEIIENSNKFEIISLSSIIYLNLYKLYPNTIPENEKLFTKIGKLFLFNRENLEFLDNKEQEKEELKLNDNENYYICIQMNSLELNYQFLVNALYYWEEDYPSELSKYKFENDTNFKLNPLLSVENTYKTKLFNYFNPNKNKSNKCTLMLKIIEERISNIKRALEEANKKLSDSKTSKNDIQSIEERKKKLQISLEYNIRIKKHIQLSEEIGEISTIRGYAILKPKYSHLKARKFCDYIYKAYNKELPHFKCELDKDIPLFNDEIIYPNFPNKDTLLPGCTNILKEVTKNYLNVTLIRENEYNKLNENYAVFAEQIKKNSSMDNKNVKIGKYNQNYLLGYSRNVINSVNYNLIQKEKIIGKNNILTGKSVSMIIQHIITLIYEIYSYNIQTFESLLKKIRIKLKNIKNEFKEENYYNIIGILLFANDYYKVIRLNTKVITRTNQNLIGGIIDGGDKSGKNICTVLYNLGIDNNQSNTNSLIKPFLKTEKINLNNIIKYKQNIQIVKNGSTFQLIRNIPLIEIIEAVIFSFENYQNDKKFINKILLHQLLSLLNNKKIESDELLRFYTKNEASYNKLISILKDISDATIWLEKEDRFWESEFIDSFERLYNNLTIDKDIGIYSPLYRKKEEEKKIIEPKKEINENPNLKIEKIQNLKNEDYLTEYNLPSSSFISQLPKLTDYSKITSALKNIIIFERYLVGEIFAYCQKQYRDDEYINSLSQIRYHLSNGDIASARSDINTIFDGNKTPNICPLPKEQFDAREIFTEEIYPNNFYLAKFNGKEIPVLVLIQDNSINQALCLIYDDIKGKINSIWVNSDSLMFLERQIKFSSSSFNSSELIEEYIYLEKKLSILYAKNSLSNIIGSLAQKGKIEKFDDLMYFMLLNNWKNFKSKPFSEIFHSLNQYITYRKDEKKENDSNNSNEKTLKKTLSFNLNDIFTNLNSNNNKSNTNSLNSEIKLTNILLSNIDNSIVENSIFDWVISEWNEIPLKFKTKKVNLFKDLISKNDLNPKLFHIGNFSNKNFAIHELFEEDNSLNNSGIILTFSQKASLGPQAKCTFYSDPYGENLISEITSMKTLTSNLETCTFNYPKIWMKYTPGTRAFYIYEWDIQSYESDLPCLITLIPYNWILLIQLTDYCTSALFSYDNENFVNEKFKTIINVLFSLCISNNLPAVVQRRIFTITNRVILKFTKYTQIHNPNEINNEKEIKDKLQYIGLTENNFINIINKINNTFNTHTENNSQIKFSSAYLVEGVEIILSILTYINEPFNTLSNHFSINFKYDLPIWMEAIIKMGQLLNYLSNLKENKLESSLLNEIKMLNDIENSLYNNIILLKLKNNIKNDESDKLKENIIKLIKENDGLIVDTKKDILSFNDGKYFGILLDGFILNNTNKKVKEEEKKEEEDPMWTCFYCKMDNDKENTFCIFCDKNKKVLPKEKPKKVEPLQSKPSLISTNEEINNLMNDKMSDLLDKIKSTNIIFNLVDKIYQGNDLLLCNDTSKPLNLFLYDRLQLYLKEEDYLKEKIRIINENKIDNNLLNQINNISSLINKDNIIEFFSQLSNKGIDLWFDYCNISPLLDNKNNEIEKLNLNLLEKIVETIDGKIIKNPKYNSIPKSSSILPSTQIRIIPLNFNQINHIDNFISLSNCPLNFIRYYWSIIKYFNNCLSAALPYIKPPNYFNDNNINDNNDNSNKNLKTGEFIQIPFPKTISSFLSATRGIMFNYIKNDLINDVISHTEYTEEEIQIPELKFERLDIASNIEKKKLDINKMIINNNNYNEDNYDGINNNNNESNLLLQNNLSSNESMFLQAFNQYKKIDISNFRSKKFPGDPKVAFKVIFKNEFVQGIGGPYRQLFSDISRELNSILPLLYETSNNQEKKGEFKDRYTINPNNIDDSALEQYEFLGVLMGICIRTGVHLTLDLCSLVWKKIIDEDINLNDIYQFDEGLYNMIKMINDSDNNNDNLNDNNNNNNDKENNDEMSLTYSTHLTDNSLKLFIPNGDNIKFNLSKNNNEKIKYLSLLISTRINESEEQILKIKQGLSEIIPLSLLKLLTYKEVETLVTGNKIVDIELLKKNTKLSNDLKPESDKVKWLWEILSEINDDEKVKFIKFCWAQERLPSTNDEFIKNQITFTIKNNIDKKSKDGFPRADTCFFNLELPDYSSKEIMKKKLIAAINLDNDSMNADKVNVINTNNLAAPLRGGGLYNIMINDNYIDDSYDDFDEEI